MQCISTYVHTGQKVRFPGGPVTANEITESCLYSVNKGGTAMHSPFFVKRRKGAFFRPGFSERDSKGILRKGKNL